jgi:Zn-finger nucleic acid-binding protein
MENTKTCDHCGKEINSRYLVCPLCGGQLPDRFEPLSPVCPRCQTALTIHIHNKEEYDLCQGCGGMWLDRDEFHLATREFTVFRDGDKGQYFRDSLKDTLEYVPCVRCGKVMNRKNFGRISGVVIDECARHGVWLDAGELEKIRHFIADGGLDRARDREIEKTRTELKELATRVDQTAFTQKIIHFWNFKRWLFGR